MDQWKRWEEFLPLVEFTYNNSYQSTIKMVPFEFLYGKPCQTPLSWDRLEDRVMVLPEAIQEMENQMQTIRQRIKEAQDRQKSYVDAHRVDRVNSQSKTVLSVELCRGYPSYWSHAQATFVLFLVEKILGSGLVNKLEK
jgi:hypothetical protein